MIRHYKEGDHIAIAKLFTRAVHEIACDFYTREQCLAWTSREPNPAHWEKRCALKRPFVKLLHDQVAGFLELDSDGHIDCAYVNPDFARQGVMTELVDHAVHICFKMRLPKVYVEASICARPIFEKLHFSVISEQWVELKGQRLKNFHMERVNAEFD